MQVYNKQFRFVIKIPISNIIILLKMNQISAHIFTMERHLLFWFAIKSPCVIMQRILLQISVWEDLWKKSRFVHRNHFRREFILIYTAALRMKRFLVGWLLVGWTSFIFLYLISDLWFLYFANWFICRILNFVLHIKFISIHIYIAIIPCFHFCRKFSIVFLWIDKSFLIFIFSVYIVTFFFFIKKNFLHNCLNNFCSI